MKIMMDEVSIRCMGCSQSISLNEALRQNWRMCENCNYFICEFCYSNLGAEKFCISYICRPKRRPIAVSHIPVEKIMIFAGSNYRAAYKQGLLYQLFYKDAEGLMGSPFFLVADEDRLSEESDRPTKVQEEVWKNHQLVVTKRRGGKFVHWEKIL